LHDHASIISENREEANDLAMVCNAMCPAPAKETLDIWEKL